MNVMNIILNKIILKYVLLSFFFPITHHVWLLTVIYGFDFFFFELINNINGNIKCNIDIL